jgi:methylenetetrahydrofolate reductase (NADPH)
VPNHPQRDLIGYCAQAAAAGVVPVPHIAVRNLTSADELSNLLAQVAGRGVRRVLVIAGDRDRPAGPFAAALDVVESGLLQRHGIAGVDVAGYPDGHPRIAPEALERALAAKIEAAEQTGLKVQIVTQFCFDAHAIIRFIERLRDLGFEQRVRIGMAGPTNLTSLLRYAQRCGVRASASGMVRQSGLVRNMFGVSAPDGIIRALADASAAGGLGDVAAHFYSFGGIGAAARWASAAANGRFTLDGRDGFAVAPP